MPIKDALEMLMKIFDGTSTQFVRKNKTLPTKEAHMNTLADELVSIQTSSESSLSRTLARGIRREPMHSLGEREFAAVMQVMLHHMPDDPGA